MLEIYPFCNFIETNKYLGNAMVLMRKHLPKTRNRSYSKRQPAPISTSCQCYGWGPHCSVYFLICYTCNSCTAIFNILTCSGKNYKRIQASWFAPSGSNESQFTPSSEPQASSFQFFLATMRCFLASSCFFNSLDPNDVEGSFIPIA